MSVTVQLRIISRYVCGGINTDRIGAHVYRRMVTMGRLIDIDRLCNDLAKRWSIADKKKENTIRAVMADVVTPIVVSQPTVDAVPVVKCRDCKHWVDNDGFNHDHGAECSMMRMWMQPGDYCSYAKRREEAEE